MYIVLFNCVLFIFSYKLHIFYCMQWLKVIQPQSSRIYLFICLFLSTDLQLLSQSESRLMRLRRDQREREGGRRRGEDRPPCASSPPVTFSPPSEHFCVWGDRLRLLPRFPLVLLQVQSDWSWAGTPGFDRFFWEWVLCFSLWRVLRDWWAWCGLGERDRDSVSSDGGRTASVGMGRGLAIALLDICGWILLTP